jgi:hypothetical protein
LCKSHRPRSSSAPRCLKLDDVESTQRTWSLRRRAAPATQLRQRGRLCAVPDPAPNLEQFEGCSRLSRPTAVAPPAGADGPCL